MPKKELVVEGNRFIKILMKKNREDTDAESKSFDDNDPDMDR